MQGSLLGQLAFLPVRPGLVLLLVLACAVTCNVREALVWAFVGGLLVDLFSATPLGTSSLVMMVAVVAIGAAGINVFRRGAALSILFAFPASILCSILTLILYRFFGYQIDLLQVFIRTVLPVAVMNVILVPLAYRLVLALNRIPGKTAEVVY